MSRICISIDDVKGIFKVLKEEYVDSIFETRTLQYLRKLHIKYGTQFDLYCTYRHKDYTLSDVSDAYKAEFIENSDWLRFGFHCIEENEKYDDISETDFERNYCSFLSDLKRVTGQERQLDTLRLHGFRGNISVCRVLHKYNLRVLLASDDVRRNYYLGEKENDILLKEGIYEDRSEGIAFISSCTRLENIKDIKKYIFDKIQMTLSIIPIFTHEWKMDDEEVRRRLEECCKIEKEALK